MGVQQDFALVVCRVEPEGFDAELNGVGWCQVLFEIVQC